MTGSSDFVVDVRTKVALFDRILPVLRTRRVVYPSVGVAAVSMMLLNYSAAAKNSAEAPPIMPTGISITVSGSTTTSGPPGNTAADTMNGTEISLPPSRTDVSGGQLILPWKR
jgi:hypothetical protein